MGALNGPEKVKIGAFHLKIASTFCMKPRCETAWKTQYKTAILMVSATASVYLVRHNKAAKYFPVMAIVLL
jgi:hypothetical protein